MMRTRTMALALAAAFALVFTACEKPDASYVTSPSARLLIGTTTGNVALAPPEPLPAEVPAPAGWRLDFDLAVFNKLEDGTPALRILFEVIAQRGPGMELWLSNERGVVARWSGGSTEPYNGAVCFQLALRSPEKGEVLALPPGAYTATIAFRDVEKGVVTAESLKVTSNVPKLEGAAPGPDSSVFRELLGCPRGS